MLLLNMLNIAQGLCTMFMDGISHLTERWGWRGECGTDASGLFLTKCYANRDDETWAFEDEGEYRVDEKGIGYSLDGYRLLFVQHTFKDSEYIVPNGVVTICSMAFASCRQFVTLIIPRSVRLIGDFVFGPEGGKIVIKEPPSARRQNSVPSFKVTNNNSNI